MRTPFTTATLVFVLSILSRLVSAQDPLEAYIAEGLQNNLVLKQKDVSLEKAMTALQIANGMFSPSVSILGNYTNGDGGRTIQFPIGDLMNPVYQTLNQLTGSDAFPQVQNQTINFFPKDFYDVRARTSMPLFNTDLLYNRKIKQQQILIQESEVDIYRRELVRNIKASYFNYLSAKEGVTIYQSALTRSLEGKRVNESLLENGKGLPAYVLRSQSEIESIRAQFVDAERQVHNAQLYFNFLLNRSADVPIISTYPAAEQVQLAGLQLAQPVSYTQREEFMQVQTLKNINEDIVRMNHLSWSPRLSGFVDLGAQNEKFKYSSKSNYYLVGVALEVPLFAGFTNKNKAKQATLDVRNTELQAANLQQQINLSYNASRNTLISALQNYTSAQKQVEAAQSYQRLIEKGYKEGVNTFIEGLDARNQLTSAQLLLNVNQFRVLIAQANVERETASFDLTQSK
jgi:outer membrane protein TolC